MSRYGSRHDRVLDDDPHWERLMLKGVSALTKPTAQPTTPQPAEDFARLRRVNPADFLLPASRKWLQSLPEEVRPVALATSYARIVNNFAHQWNDPLACGAYFDTLLVDRRGGRKGFPRPILADLQTLHEYFVRARLPGP